MTASSFKTWPPGSSASYFWLNNGNYVSPNDLTFLFYCPAFSPSPCLTFSLCFLWSGLYFWIYSYPFVVYFSCMLSQLLVEYLWSMIETINGSWGSMRISTTRGIFCSIWIYSRSFPILLWLSPLGRGLAVTVCFYQNPTHSSYTQPLHVQLQLFLNVNNSALPCPLWCQSGSSNTFLPLLVPRCVPSPSWLILTVSIHV